MFPRCFYFASEKALETEMEKFQSKYVFASADKSAYIWKRYNMHVLIGELNSTSTYIPAKLMKDKILLQHIHTLTKIEVIKYWLLPNNNILLVVKATQKSLLFTLHIKF